MQERILPFFFFANLAPWKHPWEILGALGFGARGAGGDFGGLEGILWVWRGFREAGGGDEPEKRDAGRAVACPGKPGTADQPSPERCYWRWD